MDTLSSPLVMSQPASTHLESTPIPSSPPATSPQHSPHIDLAPPSTLTSHFVQALHDYLPDNAPQDDSASCLFFRKGAIIEVFNRDSSGWWDGLCDGVRGWFPSNYVGRIGEAVRDSADFDLVGEEWQPPLTLQGNQDDHNASMGDASQHINRIDLARALLSEDRRQSANSTSMVTQHPITQTSITHASHRQKHIPIPAWENLMGDVSQRMSDLIETCATSNDIQADIFQVVSSIRAVLTAANTVSNDSPLLKMYPELARQRKVILSTLSKMVIKSREIQTESTASAEEQIPEIARQLLLEMDLFEDTLRSVINPQEAFPGSLRSSVVSLENGSVRHPFLDVRESSRSLIAKAVPVADAQGILQAIDTHRATIQELVSELLATIQQYMSQPKHATEMLEMTRRAVDAVRTFLAVVENVCSNIGDMDYKHHSILPKDPQLVALVLAKESVYSAITNLVTAVRALAGFRGGNQDDEEHLESCCTHVLTTTNACADCVRACLQVDQPHQLSDQVDELRDRLARTVDLRRNQTLSILGRKITSLHELQHQYKQVEHTEQLDSTGSIHSDRVDAAQPGDPTGKLDNQTSRVDPDSSTSLAIPATPALPAEYTESPGAERQAAETKQAESSLVDEKEVEILEIAQLDDTNKSAPIPLAEAVRRSKALLKEHQRSSKSLRQDLRNRDTIRQSNATRMSSTSTASTSSGSLHRQSTESLSPQIFSDTTSLVSEDDVRCPPHFPPSSQLSPPSNAPVDLKISSSKSTPTHPAGRPRRSRGMSVSTLRMSIKKEDTLSVNETSSETNTDASHIRKTSSWMSMQAPHQSGSAETASTEKKLGEPDFLKHHEFSEEDIIYNAEGNITGATVQALVVSLTLHEKSPDLELTRAFLHNFRLFTDPETLVQLLRERFLLEPPPGLSAEDTQLWKERVLLPIRLRVYNVIKSWVDSYFYYEQDRRVENQLVDFVSGPMAKAMPAPASRLIESIRRAFASPSLGSIGRKYSSETRMALQKAASGSHVSLSSVSSSLFSSKTHFEEHPDMPPPSVTRSLRNTLRKCLQQGSLTSIHISEFESMELARQLTLMESTLFCKIQPNEMIGQEFKKKLGVSTAVHVKAMIQRSTQITSWVSDTILKESDPKKRAQVIKLWIKLGDACLQLNNYNTLMAIRSALDSTSIARLRKTWDYVPAKYKAMYGPIYKATDSQRNFAEYRRRLKNTVAPCLPFLGVYLTDMTFIDDGNANFRTTAGGKQLVNFDKYIKTTRILNEIDQFQIPYKLTEVEEIQLYLQQCLDAAEQDDQAFYARSLELEPREEDYDVKTIISAFN